MSKTESAWKILGIRLPQENEFTPESMSSLLSNFVQMSHSSFFNRLLGKKSTITSLEIILQNGQIHFYVTIPANNFEFFRAQILAQYPTAITKKSRDYLMDFEKTSDVNKFSARNHANEVPAREHGKFDLQSAVYQQLTLARPFSYPLKTNRDFRDTDPLSSVLSPLARSQTDSDFFLYQILLSPPPKKLAI